MQIFLVEAIGFEWILCEQNFISSHYTQSVILLRLWYLATSLYDPAIFILLL